jgi:hypothetical protein
MLHSEILIVEDLVLRPRFLKCGILGERKDLLLLADLLTFIYSS